MNNVPRRQGRGAASNPATQFDRHHYVEDPGALEAKDLRQVQTEYIVDTSRTVLAKNNSPDIPFTYGINPYRGCEHGCIYCYARPSHEYLGYSAGLDFETKIVVKKEIASLLKKELLKKSWEPQVIALSGNTDPYQPIEKRFKLTRACLEVLAWHRNPVSLITKNYLVTRDLDILEEMAALNLVSVSLSITSLKPEITGVMEPRTSRPARRLKAIEELAKRGVPVGVMIAPVIPGLTDEEMPEIMRAAADHGASWAYYVMLRLPGAVKELFVEWVGNEFPDRKNRIINRLKDLRGEDLTEKRFGLRMRGEGRWADIISQLHKNTVKQLGLNQSRERLAVHHFRRTGQQDLFAPLS